MSNTEMLLRNILEQCSGLQKDVGTCLAQLARGEEDRAALRDGQKLTQQSLDIIDRRTDIIEDKIIELDGIMKPAYGKPLVKRVETLETFHSKMGVIVLTASTVLGGAFTLIYVGLKALVENWDVFRHWLFRG